MTLSANKRFSRILAAGFALSLTSSSALAQRTETLSTGTVVKVKLDQELSSKKSRAGDRFTATVVEGLDDAGLPYGTQFEGVVSEVIRHAGDRPGSLDMEFRRVLFPNRDARTISGSLVSLDKKSVDRDAQGRLISKGTSDNERWKWVGIGAGAGLLLGGLTKSDSFITTVLGAGLGYFYNESIAKKPSDITLKAGTEFGVRLERAFAFLPDNYRAYDRTERIDPVPTRDSDADDRYDYRDETEKPGDRHYYRSGRYRNDIRVMVDDQEVAFDSQRPFLRGQTVMLPFATVARAAGIRYTFDSAGKTILIRRGDLRLSVDNRVAYAEGKSHRLAARAEIRNGVLFAPMDFVALALDGEALYDASGRTLNLRSKAIAE